MCGGLYDGIGGEFRVLIKSIVKRLHHQGLDLGAGEAGGNSSQQVKIKVFGVTVPPLQVDAENLFALLVGGQVYEEYLVEAAFTQQLRGKGGDIVRGGHDESGRLCVLH